MNLRGMMVNMLGVPAEPTEPAQARVLDAVYEFVDEDEGPETPSEASEASEEPQALEELPGAELPVNAETEPVEAAEEPTNGRTQRFGYSRR